MKHALSLSLVVLASLMTVSARARTARCADVEIPMSVSGLGTVTMSGEYCVPKGRGTPRAALFFVHGSFNNRSEFDFPFKEKDHSRTEIATEAGFAVLNIDRIGSGESTIPADAADVTVARVVESLHLALVALRTGALRTAGGRVVGAPVNRVACFGSSLSTVYMWALGAWYDGDCQALVTSGSVHGVTDAWFAAILEGKSAFPANVDPTIARPDLPPGYVTSIAPGFDGCPIDTRPCNDSAGWTQRFFIDPLVVSQHTVSVAEQNKGYTSNALVFETAGMLFAPPGASVSTNVTVPVLMFAGAKDWVHCGAPITPSSTCTEQELEDFEDPYFPNTTFDVILVPGAPHYVHLAPEYRPTFLTRVVCWLAHRGIVP